MVRQFYLIGNSSNLFCSHAAPGVLRWVVANLTLTIKGDDLGDIAREVSTLNNYFQGKGTLVTDAQVAVVASKVRAAGSAVRALRAAIAAQDAKIKQFNP